MEVRYFQIIIPLLALILIIRHIRRYYKSKSGIYETILLIIFWLGVLLFAIFPDLISVFIAKIFGIKDNVNAIIFFALGLLFYFQFQLFKMIKKQDELMTEIARKIALDESGKLKNPID